MLYFKNLDDKNKYIQFLNRYIVVYLFITFLIYIYHSYYILKIME